MITTLRCFFAFHLILFASASAAVITSGNFNSGSPAPTLEITSEISFAISVAGDLRGIAFNEWVTSDGAANTATVAPFGQTISYRINGGVSQIFTPVNSVIDNAASPANGLTANDGYLFLFNTISVFPGDSISFQPGTFTFNATPGFNSAVPALFNGQAFVIDGAGRALSGLVSVPEPSGILLSLAGLSACLARRKR